MNTSRRQVVRSALFSAAALSQWKGLNAFAIAQDYTDGPVNPQRTLYQPMEVTTFSALDQFFPSYRTSAALKPLLPFTAVLKNGGKDPVKAYEMRWVHNAGEVDTTLFSTIFVSPPSLTGGSALGTGWNTIVNPGEYAVVTPLFLWSATKYRRLDGAVPVNKLMASRAQAQLFLASASPSVAYRVRRDAKICRHTAIGNLSSMTSQFQATVNYEKQIAAQLIASARTPGELEPLAIQMLNGINQVHAGLGTRVKVRYLESVRARIRAETAGNAWLAVQKIASRPPLVLTQRNRKHVYSVPA